MHVYYYFFTQISIFILTIIMIIINHSIITVQIKCINLKAIFNNLFPCINLSHIPLPANTYTSLTSMSKQLQFTITHASYILLHIDILSRSAYIHTTLIPFPLSSFSSPVPGIVFYSH